MKRSSLTLLLSFCALSGFSQPEKPVDTLYYGTDHKSVLHRAFADYYQIVPATTDTCSRKPFRTFYMTGELRVEGSYIRLDSTDARRTRYDGPWTEYYRSGQIRQKGTLIDGKWEGEHTIYSENGLIKEHAFYAKGELFGVRTLFNGDLCIRTEYENGALKYDYYTLSKPDGYCSKYRLTDNTPVWESPEPSEMDEAYRNGKKWKFYEKNGLTVSVTGCSVSDYGKYFRLQLLVVNNSLERAEVDPANIMASLTDKAGYAYSLKVFGSDEYLRKVRRRQSWNSVLYGVAEGIDAVEAATGTGSYSGATTTGYDAAAAYQARMIAENRLDNYRYEHRFERAVREQGYLKRTTLFPGDDVAGYVLIERRKGKTLYLTIDVKGAVYTYSWEIEKELPRE